MKRKEPNKGQSNQRSKLVEEYALLDAQVQNVKPLIQRHEKLRHLILSWRPEVPADEEFTVPGLTCDILITSRDRIRTVSLSGKKALFKLWGQAAFIAKAQVLLKALPDPEDEEHLYTVQELTGPRHLHVVARTKTAADEPAA